MLRGLLVCALCTALLCACAAERADVPANNDYTLTQALAELDALATPAGVGDQYFGELRQSLRKALLASGQTRFASTTPEAAAGEVTDLTLVAEGGSNVRLEWTYRNKGDYDQNKQVTISDLSALGANLGKGSASTDWLSKAIAADGDGNSEITISDITPIGANLAATVQGYQVQSTLTPENAASWTSLAEVAHEDSAFEPGNALRQFSHSFGAVSGTWYRVVPYDASDLGAASNTVQFAFSTPVVISVAPLTGVAGTAATFVATIGGGTVQTWEWDFGGAATPDTSGSAQPSVMLSTAGTYDATLTVSNAEGSDTIDFTIEIVNPDPPLILDVQPRSGSEDEQVTFVATLSGGAVEAYAWDFAGATVPRDIK